MQSTRMNHGKKERSVTWFPLIIIINSIKNLRNIFNIHSFRFFFFFRIPSNEQKPNSIRVKPLSSKFRFYGPRNMSQRDFSEVNFQKILNLAALLGIGISDESVLGQVVRIKFISSNFLHTHTHIPI